MIWLDAIDIPPCRSLCVAFNNDCGYLLSSDLLLNCAEIDPHTHTYRFPDETVSYRLPNGDIVTYPCNDMIPSGNEGN